MKTKFYEYTQNNSGGSFTEDEKLCHRVFIEDKNIDDANTKAENIGIYFNGLEDGLDCECCGDRWCQPNEIKFPYTHGTFDLCEAKDKAKQYNLEYKKTVFRFLGKGKPNPNEYDLIFNNVESYAKYLANEFGFGGIDARIYYLKGEVIDIK